MFKSSKFYYIVSFLSIIFFIITIIILWYTDKLSLLLIKAIYLPFITWIVINIMIGLLIELYRYITRDQRDIENRIIETKRKTYYV